MDLVHPREMVVVERADRRQRRLALGHQKFRVAAAQLELTQGRLGIAEARAVDLLELAQALLALAIGRGELRIALEGVLAPGIEHQVHGALAEVLVKLQILGLALLPPGGHRGESADDPGARHRFAQGGRESLRSEGG